MHDGQMMLGFGQLRLREILPEEKHRELTVLLGRMLLAAVESRPGKEER